MEAGTVFEAQEEAQISLPQAAASSTSVAGNAVGINLDALEHINGTTTIGIMNGYIPAILRNFRKTEPDRR